MRKENDVIVDVRIVHIDEPVRKMKVSVMFEGSGEWEFFCGIYPSDQIDFCSRELLGCTWAQARKIMRRKCKGRPWLADAVFHE